MSVVLAWDLQSGWRGASVPDLSVVGNDGICHGFVDVGMDCARFDGVSSYIQSSNTGMTDTNYFIEMLIRPHDITIDQVVCDQANGFKRSVLLGYQNGYFNFYGVGGYPTGTAADTQIQAYLDQWQYLVMGTDGTKVYGYSNGIEVVEETGTWLATGGTAFLLGCKGDTLKDANIDVKFVKVHNSILTEDYVKNKWNAIARFVNLHQIDRNLLPDQRVYTAGEYLDQDVQVQSGSFKNVEQEKIDTSNLFDPGKGTYEINTESWVAYGNNIFSRDTVDSHSGCGCLKGEYVDQTNGGYLYFSTLGDCSVDLVVGHWYQVMLWCRVNTGSSVKLRADTIQSDFITSTSWVKVQIVFQATNIHSYLNMIGSMTAGEIIWLDDITIQEIQPIPAGDKFVEGLSSPSILSFPSNHAYGTWTFEMYKASSQWCIVQMISGKLDTFAYDGYALTMSATFNRFVLQRRDNPGDVTIMRQADNSIFDNTWYKVKVTRTLDGEWYTWIDGELLDISGGSGTNPKVDNTYTSGVGALAYLGPGSRVRNFKWKYGVEI